MSVFADGILLATDGSPEAEDATRIAVKLSGALGSGLHVIYVEPMPDPLAWPESTVWGPELREDIRRRSEEEARAKLDGEAEKISAMGGKIAELHPGVGRPDAEIVRVAEELGAGLVVIGSRGLGPVRRAVMGSVSGSVVRHAHGSVLVVRGEGHLPGRILLAIDGSGEASAATEAAVEISTATGSELHVLFALSTDLGPPYPHVMLGERNEAILEQAKHDAREFVDRRAREIEAQGGTVKDAHLAFGRPDAEIVKLGEELEAGLVVVGSRGLGGVRRALLGSVSDSVVRHAHGPVLVVRDRRRAADVRTAERERLLEG